MWSPTLIALFIITSDLTKKNEQLLLKQREQQDQIVILSDENLALQRKIKGTQHSVFNRHFPFHQSV